jgi:TPR repeat protein
VLGLCYLYGIDVEINYAAAFQYLSTASEQGASRAVLNIGRMYGQGLGIQQNIPEAIRHFEAVGKHSDSVDAFAARIELGRIFSRGGEGATNTALALKWYAAALEISVDSNDQEDIREAREYVEQSSK